MYNFLYKKFPAHTAWLFYFLTPLILGVSLMATICSHFYYSETIKNRENRPSENEDQQCLLDEDENSESFSEFDPDATPLDWAWLLQLFSLISLVSFIVPMNIEYKVPMIQN